MEFCSVIHSTSVGYVVMICYKASERPQVNICCLCWRMETNSQAFAGVCAISPSHSKLISCHSRSKQQLWHEPLKIPLIGICPVIFCVHWNLQWVCEIFQLPVILYRNWALKDSVTGLGSIEKGRFKRGTNKTGITTCRSTACCFAPCRGLSPNN